MAAMRAFVDTIAASDASITIQSVAWLIPIVQSIHILAIAVVMSCVVMMDLRLAGLARSTEPVNVLLGRYLPWVWRALPVLLISGLVLIVGEPERELMSQVFWAKMTMLALAIALCVAIMRAGAPVALDALPAPNRARLRVLALASLALWFAIVSCGRLIAYL